MNLRPTLINQLLILKKESYLDKVNNPADGTYYIESITEQLAQKALQLFKEIEANESMIVLHTTPGSASLLARHLDTSRRAIGILGTIAGDDTIFVVPASTKKITTVIRNMKQELL